jgi:hypothetical protein
MNSKFCYTYFLLVALFLKLDLFAQQRDWSYDQGKLMTTYHQQRIAMTSKNAVVLARRCPHDSR